MSRPSDRNGAELPVHLVGNGPLVVLVHPSGLDARFWNACVPYLSDRLTVATFDRPRHGREVAGGDTPPREVSTPGAFLAWLDERRRNAGPDEVDLLTRWLTATGRPVHVVGVLDGGLLALRAATGPAGSTVDGVVTLDSVVPGIGGDPAQVIDAAGLDGLQELADVIPSVLRERDPTPYVDWFVRRNELTGAPPRLLAEIREMVGSNVFSGLIPAPPPVTITADDLRSRNPRLLIMQSRERPGPLRELDTALAATIPGSRIEPLHGTSFLPMQDPREFSDRVLRHLLG